MIMHVGLMSMFKHDFYVYIYIYSSAGGAIGISIEQYCVISSCDIMASMHS